MRAPKRPLFINCRAQTAESFKQFAASEDVDDDGKALTFLLNLAHKVISLDPETRLDVLTLLGMVDKKEELAGPLQR